MANHPLFIWPPLGPDPIKDLAEEITLDLDEEETEEIRATLREIVDWCPRCQRGSYHYISWDEAQCWGCGYPGLKSTEKPED